MPSDSYLTGSNIGFIEALYARFLDDPNQVDPSWREIFRAQGGPGTPIIDGPPEGSPARVTNGHDRAAANGAPLPQSLNGLAKAPAAGLGDHPAVTADRQLQARVDQAIYAFRLRGHLLAQLDPLERPRPPLKDASDLAMVRPDAFTPEELEQVVDANQVFNQRSVKLRDLLARLRRTYCHHVGAEYMTILDSRRRQWLAQRMEHVENRVEPPQEEQVRILSKLAYAEAFEHVLAIKDKTAKRFSIDGAEALVPMIDVMLDEAGYLGVVEVVIGMAHRGRLNVLANVLRKSPDEIFSEFRSPSDPKAFMGRGDVKYHLGFSSDHVTQSGHKIHLSLAFNPSHLEIVDPVVVGRVRAKQDRKGMDRDAAVPLLIHGDAAFAGQGVVMETLNLSALPGYEAGGTVHLVVNNQLGFTTDPEDSRSSLYCTGIAQMLDIPVFHVNGDDPEACAYVMRLATQYRQAFHSDVVVDLVCYRRLGHNESDEPMFTQPQMYQLINSRPKVRRLYAQDLARRGRVTADESDAIWDKCVAHFTESYDRVLMRSQIKEPSALEGLWRSFRGGPEKDAPRVDTGVPVERLSALLRSLASVPQGFTVIRQIRQLLDRRAEMADGQKPLDWGAAEHLAMATLLADEVPIRLTGQDSERGTFSHRHAVIHDANTGAHYIPLAHVASEQGPFWIYNSPLSEMGPMGFEFGFSLDYPDALVMWEAQFGDFANMAQGIIDQFIAASEDKWRRISGLTLLLPHGYEGMGPEHSSARLERFLDLCADDNLQICYPSTPAQIFHLLRRQVMRSYRKPLVVMTPKQLLRLPECTSPLEALATGGFHRLMEDPANPDPLSVKRLILCAGKIFYDLQKARSARPDPSVAILRLEQLYPLPSIELGMALQRYAGATEIFWVQEEPRNMGAWRYLSGALEQVIEELGRRDTAIAYVGRAESAGPATGMHATHDLEQKIIVEQALAQGGLRGH